VLQTVVPKPPQLTSGNVRPLGPQTRMIWPKIGRESSELGQLEHSQRRAQPVISLFRGRKFARSFVRWLASSLSTIV